MTSINPTQAAMGQPAVGKSSGNDAAKANARIQEITRKIKEYTEDIQKINDSNMQADAKEMMVQLKMQMIQTLQTEMTSIQSEMAQQTDTANQTARQLDAAKQTTDEQNPTGNPSTSSESAVLHLSDEGKTISNNRALSSGNEDDKNDLFGQNEDSAQQQNAAGPASAQAPRSPLRAISEYI